MRTKKRLLALLLALAMMVAMCGTAWAENPSSGEEGGDEEPATTWTIEGIGSDGEVKDTIQTTTDNDTIIYAYTSQRLGY